MAAIESVQPSPVYSAPNVVSSPRATSTSSEQKRVQQNVQNERQVSEQEVRQAVEQANADVSRLSNESISFGYEERIGMLYVQVTDKSSGEVIREIPSKDFIQHKVAMNELVGLLLDKQA